MACLDFAAHPKAGARFTTTEKVIRAAAKLVLRCAEDDGSLEKNLARDVCVTGQIHFKAIERIQRSAVIYLPGAGAGAAGAGAAAAPAGLTYFASIRVVTSAVRSAAGSTYSRFCWVSRPLSCSIVSRSN